MFEISCNVAILFSFNNIFIKIDIKNMDQKETYLKRNGKD